MLYRPGTLRLLAVVTLAGLFVPSQAAGQVFNYITPVEVTPATADVWTNVDVTAYVPVGATGAIVHWVADNGNNMKIGLRKPGPTPDNRFRNIAGNAHLWGMAGLDGNRSFDAYLTSTTKLHLWLVGYTTSGVTFFDNATVVLWGPLNTWVGVDIDISGETAPDTAIGAIVEVRAQGWDEDWGLRMRGSTDDRREMGWQVWAVVGVDDLQVFQGRRDNANVEFFVVGYITSGATFFANAKEYSVGGINAWLPMDISPDTMGLANGAIIECWTSTQTATSRWWGLQKNGSGENIYEKISGGGSGHAWGIFELDANQIFEGKIDHLSQDFFLVGYTHKKPLLYWADPAVDKIQRVDIDGSGAQDLVTTGLLGTRYVALDMTNGKIYWTDHTTDKIQCANLDGTGVEDLITTGLTNPRGIALDVGAKKMYWVDRGSLKVQRANLDGTGVEDLVTTGLGDPRGIALDITKGKMYWTDVTTDKIQRANLDGSGVEDRVTTGLSFPLDIDVDAAGGRMYWTDDGTNKIQRANLDGLVVVEDLITTGLTGPRGITLDVAGGTMYFTDIGTVKIQKANLDGTGVGDVLTAGITQPEGIDIGVPSNPSLPGLTLADHDSGQKPDAFSDAGSEVAAELFGFKLDPGTAFVTVDQLVFQLTTIDGLADGDWTNVEVVDAGATMSVPGTVSGTTITFTTDFTLSTATNYILRADFTTLDDCDKVTIDLNAVDIAIGGSVSGSTTSASHVEGTGCVNQTFYYITPVEKTPGSTGWSNVDVSAEAPVGATGAIVHWLSDSLSSLDIGLRKPAGAPDTRFGNIAAGAHLWAMAGLDGNRSFDAYISDATDLHLWVVGYTTAGVTFFDNAIDISLSTTNQWDPIDISGDTAPDTAIGAIIEVQTASWMRKFGLQMNGSNDDRFEIARQCWAVVGVDGLQKLEGYRTHGAVDFWLVGYITAGATFFPDAKDISLASAGPVNPFQEIDITAHTTELANGAFIQSFTTFSSKYGLQPKGLSENALKKISSGSATGHAWGIIEVDVNEILEAQIDNISHDFFMVGYSHGGGRWMATGSYTGNSPSSQSITGVGFQPQVVFVKKYPANKYGYVRTATMSGGLSKKIHYANPLEADQIQTLDPDGFTVGSGLDVNASGDTGYWIAFSRAPGTLKVGTYPGTGVTQSIGGVGFQPNVVMVFPDGGTGVSCFRTSTMPDDTSAKFDTAPNGHLSNGSNWIKLLESDGFQVGTNAKVNKSGITYHYVAFKTVAGQVEVGTYGGDGSNDHDIPVSFEPKYVIVYGDDPGLITPGGSHAIIHRPDSMVGNTSLNMSWGYAADTFVDTIKALEPTGFQVGSDVTVNKVGTTYHWIAFGASATGTTPKPKIIKWVEVDPYGP